MARIKRNEVNIFTEFDSSRQGQFSSQGNQAESEPTPPSPNLYQENGRVDSLKLALPEPLTLTDLSVDYGVAAKDVTELQRIKDHFEAANRIQVLCGSFGLGDAILQLRYTVLMAQKINKPVVCQITSALEPLARQLTTRIPNLTFVNRFTFESLNEPGTFTLKPDLGPLSRKDISGAFTQPQQSYDRDALLEYFLQLKADYQIANDYQFTQPFINASPNDIYHHLEDDNLTQGTDYKMGLIYTLLGVSISAAEVETQTLVSFDESELDKLPQDLDVVVLPDAKEFETQAGDRSEKSLPLSFWATYFARLQASSPNQNSVGIVRGVSHPDYCQRVIDLATQSGLKVTVIEGDLLEVSHQLLRAKTVVGMDSGTTHLALDVKRWAQLHGRNINLLSLFRQSDTSFYKSYGIIDAPTFMFTNSMESEDEERLLSFLLN